MDFKNHIIIEQHACQCERSLCMCATSKRVIFLNNRFWLLEFFSCYKYGQPDCDFILDFITNATKAKKKNYRLIEKSIHLDDDFKELRLRGRQLKRFVKEVIYIYSCNRNKKYCLTREKPYLENLYNSDIITESYKELLEYLNNKKNTNQIWGLKEDLDELYLNNIAKVSETEVVKTIDQLSKLLNKKIKEKV